MCAALDRVLILRMSGCAMEPDSSFATQEVASDVWQSPPFVSSPHSSTWHRVSVMPLEFDLTREDSDHDPVFPQSGDTEADPPFPSVESQRDHNRILATESGESDTESDQCQSNRRRRLQLTWNSEQQDVPPQIHLTVTR